MNRKTHLWTHRVAKMWIIGNISRCDDMTLDINSSHASHSVLSHHAPLPHYANLQAIFEATRQSLQPKQVSWQRSSLQMRRTWKWSVLPCPVQKMGAMCIPRRWAAPICSQHGKTMLSHHQYESNIMSSINAWYRTNTCRWSICREVDLPP